MPNAHNTERASRSDFKVHLKFTMAFNAMQIVKKVTASLLGPHTRHAAQKYLDSNGYIGWERIYRPLRRASG
jgi:hypothetical protein